MVRIQEQCRSCGVEPLGPCPDIVRKPFGLFLLYAGLSILFEKKKNRKKETP